MNTLMNENSTSYVDKAGTFADSYFDRGYNQLNVALTSDSVQAALKDMGLQAEVKSLTKERIKSILAAYALFKIFTGVKTNIIKIGIVGLGGYLVYTNKDKIAQSYENVINYTA